jgi:hypothetical protein
MRSKTCLVLAAVSALLVGCADSCPDKELYDFDRDVSTKTEATDLFRQFFTEEKGYPTFDETKVYEYPTSKRPFVYWDLYGQGPNGVGGVLYEDGLLVQAGYCK